MQYIKEIEAYLRMEMSPQELEAFELLMKKNDLLAQEVKEYEELFTQLQHARNEAYVSKQIKIIQEQEERNTMNISSGLDKYVKKYWRTAGIAATVAFLASVGTYFIAENTFNSQNDKRILQLVNKEVRDIKNKQVSLQNDIDEVTNALPSSPHKGSGTAFAINNQGYAITNLHVILGGKKVYIFTKDGKAHRCKLVLKDVENDLAVLKLTDSTFQFSQNDIPYSLDKEAKLAQRVFTLGFPKDEVVYNEGYISALNGKSGDSSKYQLELPSSPGVSGAPILDNNGNLMGIINSKESKSLGITYAIKSGVVGALLDSLEQPFSQQALTSNSFKSKNRSAQIEELQDFVFMVKVYK